jgi:hypothetical protein
MTFKWKRIFIALFWILQNLVGKQSSALIMSVCGRFKRQVAGSCDCCNELSGSIKCGEFFERLRNCSLLKRDSAAWSWLVGYLFIYLFIYLFSMEGYNRARNS